MTQNNFLISLALDQIREFTNPDIPREEADLVEQEFSVRLDNAGRSQEQGLLLGYLQLNLDEFTGLAPEVHTWLLQRLLGHLDLLERELIRHRIAVLFFIYWDGLVRRVIIDLLVALEQEGSRSLADQLIRAIHMEIKTQSSGERPLLVTEFTNLLFEVGLQARAQDDSGRSHEEYDHLPQFEEPFRLLETLTRLVEPTLSGQDTLVSSQIRKRSQEFEGNLRTELESGILDRVFIESALNALRSGSNEVSKSALVQLRHRERVFGERSILVNIDLRGADFSYADLRNVNLNGANLEGVNLNGASLENTNLIGANFQGALLNGASLQGSRVNGANLQNVQMQGADISGADLHFARLDRANLLNANLIGANLSGAVLSGARLDGARLHNTVWDVDSVLPDNRRWNREINLATYTSTDESRTQGSSLDE